MFVCCECCVFSGRGLCDELITRPEEPYRLCCVVVCDLETTKILVNEEAKAHQGAIAPGKKSKIYCRKYTHSNPHTNRGIFLRNFVSTRLKIHKYMSKNY